MKIMASVQIDYILTQLSIDVAH